MHTIEFFFDCSSPWTYLAFESIQPLTERDDVELVWKPILVGGIFNTVNPSVYATRENPVPAKARYQQKDLQDWANHVGIEIGQVLALMGVLIGLAFWLTYRPVDGRACPVSIGRVKKVLLWSSAALWVLAVAIQFAADRYWL